jgi:hypothetical protein
MADLLNDANATMFSPNQGETLNPWRQRMPYSMDPGSTYGQGQPAAGGTAQGGGTDLMSAIGPMVGSLFAPSQGGQQPPAQQAPPPQQPQYVFGADTGDNTAEENKANAAQIGAGVLAASQAAAKSGGGGMKKKKPGQQGDTGDAGLGATPGSEGM